MAQNLSRFLQLSDSILMEYSLNNEYVVGNSTSEDQYTYNYINVTKQNSTVLRTVLSDGGTVYLRYIDSSIVGNSTTASGLTDYDTNNHFYNSPFPMDKDGVEWITYLNDGKGSDASAREFAESWYSEKVGSIVYADGDASLSFSAGNDLPADTIKMHILSGYNLTDIFGFKLRVSVPSAVDGTTVVLADWIYTRNQEAFQYEDAMMIGNKIYDKYVRLEIPSVQYLIANKMGDANDITKVLDVRPNCNITIDFSYIYAGDYSKYYPEYIDPRSATEETAAEKLQYANQYKFFLSTLFTTDIALDSNSERFNLFLKEGTSGNGNYFEFCSTWDNAPLTYERVLSLNTTIPLYDTSVSTRNDIDTVDITGMPWCVIHEITAQLRGNGDDEKTNTVISEEKFNYTQMFTSPLDDTVFYYRPLFASIAKTVDSVSYTANEILLTYTCRLVNRFDGTQIVRRGTLSTNDYHKYLTKNLRIPSEYFSTYNVFNRIEKNEQKVASVSGVEKTKYIKTYYNSSDIVMDSSGNYYGSADRYSLPLGNSAKNYKFSFKRMGADGSTAATVDFSVGSYVLYTRDANGSDVTIPCTYSANMNPIIGELEFYISNQNLVKLKAVPSADRFLAIMVVNSNQEKSSVFEMGYSF